MQSLQLIKLEWKVEKGKTQDWGEETVAHPVVISSYDGNVALPSNPYSRRIQLDKDCQTQL